MFTLLSTGTNSKIHHIFFCSLAFVAPIENATPRVPTKQLKKNNQDGIILLTFVFCRLISGAQRKRRRTEAARAAVRPFLNSSRPRKRDDGSSRLISSPCMAICTSRANFCNLRYSCRPTPMSDVRQIHRSHSRPIKM